MEENKLNSAPIAEMFTSIDGEVNHEGQGVLSHFIRVAGCNLKCPWCDTKKAQITKDFPIWDPNLALFSLIKPNPSVRKITVTGGEPLLYPGFVKALDSLCAKMRMSMSVETNGTLPLPDFNRMHGLVVDSKPPSSNAVGKFRYMDLPKLHPSWDIIKMVIVTEEDLIWAIDETKYLVEEKDVKVPIAWSYSEGSKVGPSRIIETLLQFNMGYVIFNAQLHKYLKLK